MPGILLIGYDVEGLIEEVYEKWGDAYPNPEAVTRTFLDQAAEVHNKYDAPCTLFVLGEVLEKNAKSFHSPANSDLFDIQQHTYSHTRLKTVVEEYNGSVSVCPGGTLQEIKNDVTRASISLKEHFDIDCCGLCGPYGYYRGLSDRPDILSILHEIGIKYVRSYTRNQNDWGPLDFQVQPFWYAPQGFPDILELPGQDWQDCHFREIHGWEDIDGYLCHLKSGIDHITENNLTWSVSLHDFSSIRDDPQMTIVSGLIEYARKKHVRIASCKEYYEEIRS